MDIIIGLQKLEGHGLIIVEVDRFFKYTTIFLVAPSDYTVDKKMRLFLMHVFKYWGLPKHIINDCHPHFTRKF